MKENYRGKRRFVLPGWKYPRLTKPESDGSYCYMMQRRISCHFSIYFMKLGLTPSQATLVDFVFGCLAALSIVFHYYLLGIFFICLFGIWSCVDGEIARLSNRCSLSGDFFDTMTDRIIEMLLIIALFLSTYTVADQVGKYLALSFIAYLGGVYLLTVSSEKYRSTVRGNYPKKKVESFFSWISAGSDIRLLWLSVVIFTFILTEDKNLLTVQIGALSTIFFVNFTFRMFVVNDLLSLNMTSDVEAITPRLDTFHGGLKHQNSFNQNLHGNLVRVHSNEAIDRISTQQGSPEMKGEPIKASIASKH